MGAHKNVIVIGPTCPDITNPADIRPGRLDQLTHILLLDLLSRVAIFKVALWKVPLEPNVGIGART